LAQEAEERRRYRSLIKTPERTLGDRREAVFLFALMPIPQIPNSPTGKKPDLNRQICWFTLCGLGFPMISFTC
jgi:hypothetical protein